MEFLNTLYKNKKQLNSFIDSLGNLRNYSAVLVQIYSVKMKEKKNMDLARFIKMKIPHSCIMGVTTAGNILNGQMVDNDTVISFSLFEKTALKTVFFDFEKEKFDMESLKNSLIGNNTKALLIFTDGLKSNGEDIIKSINEQYPQVLVAGGRAGDNYSFSKTFVFNENNASQNGMTITSLNSDELIVNSSYMLGWEPVGEPMVITRSSGNIVYEINNMPILDIYSRYLGEDVAKELPESGIEFPLIIQRDNIQIARAPVATTDNGALVFAGNLKEGEKVQFGFGNIELVQDKAKKNFRNYRKYPIEAIYIYSCGARKAFMGENLRFEFNLLEGLSSCSGFFTYGEFFHSKNISDLLNITTTFLALSEKSSVKTSKVIEKEQKPDKSFKALLHLLSVTSKDLQKQKKDIKKYNDTLAKELEKQKELLENVIDSANDIIFFKDIDFNLIGCNDQLTKLTGRPKDRIIGFSDYDIFPKEYADHFRKMDKQMLKIGEATSNCEWVVYPDGEKKYLLTTKSPLKTRNGEIYGIVGIAKDITNEFFLEKQKNEAIELNSVKSRFLANMSHEIRTPLNSILGFIDILKAEETSNEKRKYLDIMENSSKHLNSIIDDILDFSKIEKGKMSLHFEVFDIYKMIESIKKMFLYPAKDKNIDFTVNISKNVPKLISSDEIRLKQILFNLLSNSFKFTGENKKIKVDMRYKDSRLYISVEDEGIGIEKWKLEDIIEAFTQEDSSITRKYGGTGLGLAICEELLKLFGGKLQIQSQKGLGSRFFFDIFVKAVDQVELKDTIIRKNSIKNTKLHLLLVEDNKSSQLFMEVLLKKMGISFDLADDGRQAVKMFRPGFYDLILMDENMPNLSGIEAARKIREIEKKGKAGYTPIIAITANAVKGDRERFLDAGMDEYLTKPLDRSKLEEVLSDILNKPL